MCASRGLSTAPPSRPSCPQVPAAVAVCLTNRLRFWPFPLKEPHDVHSSQSPRHPREAGAGAAAAHLWDCVSKGGVAWSVWCVLASAFCMGHAGGGRARACDGHAPPSALQQISACVVMEGAGIVGWQLRVAAVPQEGDVADSRISCYVLEGALPFSLLLHVPRLLSLVLQICHHAPTECLRCEPFCLCGCGCGGVCVHVHALSHFDPRVRDTCGVWSDCLGGGRLGRGVTPCLLHLRGP